VVVSVADSANPYNMMLIRERLVEETAKGAVNALTRWQKSTFAVTSTPFHRPGEKRILLKIKPENVFYQKPGRLY
jgi:hypothetical protein